MKKRVLVLLMAVMMLVMSAAPAMADPGCKAFGHAMAHRAHQGVMGETMRDYGRNGQTSTFIYYEKAFYCGTA